MDTKRKDEEEFQAKVMANPQWKAAYGGAWDADRAGREEGRHAAQGAMFHRTRIRSSARLASNIVQYVAEIKKPDGERLPGFHEAQLESLRLSSCSRRRRSIPAWRSRA